MKTLNGIVFKPEPPENPRHVKALFHGRKKGLSRGLETLKNCLDVNGRRAKKHDKRPWVIHGESRSGKSHLARRILLGLPAHKKKKIQLIIPARERMTALVVMRNLFEELRKQFCWRIADQTLPESPMQRPIVRLVDQLSEQMRLFFGGRVEQATLTVEESARNAIEGGMDVGEPTKIFRFLAKFHAERSEKQSLQVALRNPTPQDLAELCAIIAETLIDLKLIHHLLVLVDDVDLLEGYMNAERNARTERPLLAGALVELHATPGVDVLLTSRSWYAHANKEFQTLVDLSNSPEMTADDLVGIHDCRFKEFGRNAPSQFLTKTALSAIAKDAAGLPGVFLQHLNTAFHAYQNEDEWEARDYNWFLDVFRRRIEQFREKNLQAIEALERAVRNGELYVDVTRHNPFYATVFDNEFVYQSYYNETRYFMSPMMHKIIDVPPAPGASGVYGNVFGGTLPTITDRPE